MVNGIIIFVFAVIHWFRGTDADILFMNGLNKTKLTFLDALYFSCVTHCTIGYGDFIPKSDFAKMVTIIHVLVMIMFLFLSSVY